ncbi:cAMP/cGMP-dependent 3',5'-cyclic-AMP/GMP phosphodiesterase [Planctomycetota bacterium]|nr:cAMP/cGMP-dependent 3',5'-cyclic-AMP/GMP phosphodiesterase [Planctomycetota bacterium]
MAESSQQVVVELPRGGVVVSTKAGPVQVGIPPETIKDHMELGLTVPTFYVIPSQRFHRQRGISVCEIEFPAYFCFFIQKRKITVITDAEGEARLRGVLQETLFGPESYPPSDAEYDPSVPHVMRRNHALEGEKFRKNPFNLSERMEVDTLINFVHYDDEGHVHLTDGVSVERKACGEGFVIHEDGGVLATVADEARLPPREVIPVASEAFAAPAFGVTILGASHGFDPKGKTTGFILWINHRGLLVDPPMGTTETLAAGGIAPKLIDGIILTHCHADHDSGTFQKILEEGRVDLYTTPAILGSFLRKYSALSGLDEEFLRRTFVYRPVRIGSATRVHGGELRFFYTLHSIPTIGMEAFYGGKSMIFSGDTLYDTGRIEAMVEEGVLTRERADKLIDFPWYHPLVLHEAGVPPLHTPVESLVALPDDVKERLYVVHIAEKDLPTDAGLKVAPCGVEHTLVLEVEPPRHAEAIELLDVFASIDLFRDLTLGRGREILQVADRHRYKADAGIIQAGSAGDGFYVLLSGIAAVSRDGKEIKRYQSGDYFGETALLLGQPRNADVVAVTDLELVKINRYDFRHLLRGTDIPERLVRLAKIREERSWELFAKNMVLEPLTSAQKTQLQSFLEVVDLTEGQVLWSAGQPAEFAYLIDQGEVALEGYADDRLLPFGSGAFLGEIDALVEKGTVRAAARVEESGRAFRISGTNLARWFDQNPGAMLAFIGATAIE